MMFFKLVRLFAGAAVLAAFFLVYLAGKRAEDVALHLSNLEALPDVDYRLMAEEYWAGGRQEAALACLEYVISNKLPDAPASRRLYEKYLEQIRARNTTMGQLAAFGKGFLFSDIDGFDALAGAVVADLLVYGDIRDIVKEGFVEKDGDKFVLAMSGLGLATTMFPPADSSVSLLKILQKTNSISEPLKKVFSKTAKLAVEAAADASKKEDAVRSIKQSLEPIAELSKNTRSWSQFSNVMKHASSPDEIRTVVGLLKKNPANAGKLEQIILLSRFKAGEMLSAVVGGGQVAMDRIYSLLRKGPRGLQFAAKHPALAARAGKNVSKAYVLAVSYLEGKFLDGRYNKYIAYGILSLALAFVGLSPRGVFKRALSQGADFIGAVCAVPFFYVVLAACIFLCAAGIDFKMNSSAPSEEGGGGYPTANMNWYLGYATWNVSVQLDEDHWWNDTFKRNFCAPLVKFGEEVFVACDSENLGLFWGEAAKGGVFNCDIAVERRGDNPISFVPSEFFVSRQNPHFALIRVPKEFSDELALRPFADGDLPLSERPVLFVPGSGFTANAPTLSYENGVYSLLTRAGASAGDFVVTTPRGFFLGMVSGPSKGAGGEALHVFLPKKISTNEFCEVSLNKDGKSGYFKNFSDSARRFQSE